MALRSERERRLSQSRRNARFLVESCRKRFAAGESRALMEAIHWCAHTRIALPQWAADAFTERYRRVSDMTARSWDEAFGRPWPKGMHLGQLRKRKRLKAMIHNEVSRSKIPRTDSRNLTGLFTAFGERHGISASQVSKLFYEAERDMQELLDALPATPSKKFLK